jgi:multidrug efflux pump subunit AcrA (membrane-fusion protein)
MDGRRRKLRPALTVAAVLALLGLTAVPVLRPKPVRVETARAVRGPLVVTIDAEGRTRVRERFTVAAPVTGLLRRISLRSGDAVYTGATVAVIEPAPLSSVPMSVQGGSYVPQSAIVRSPMNGRVLRVLEQSERVVTTGTPLLELSNTSQLELVVDVLSTDAVKVAPGAPLLVENWGGDAPLRGRVRLIEPSGFTKVSALGVEEQRVNVVADFADSTGRVGDGFRVEARIVVWEGEVLKVSSGALFRHGEGWGVFVVEGGKARRVEVGAGRRTSSEVEIRSGLNEGDVVVLHPSNELEDGAAVEPQAGSNGG